MKCLSSWLLIMFMGMFWIFRIVVTLAVQYSPEENFGGFIVFDRTLEIIMLFVSLLCFALILKRVIWGGVIYLVGYGFYFGKYIFINAIPALTMAGEMDIGIVQNLIIAFLGILLGLFVIIDIMFERTKNKHFSDKKTDWFFDNKDYDRKYDDRADKNQYRTL